MIGKVLCREDFLQTLASILVTKAGRSRMRVAVNGVDGAGKTRLADDLAQTIRARGRSVARASIDGFHHPRAHRYRLGRHSPEGFYRESFNVGSFIENVLKPLAPGGSGGYREAVFDHCTDSEVHSGTKLAPSDAIAIVDGIFLLTDELRSHWELTIFLDVPFEESFRRMAVRDNSEPNPLAQSSRRYRDGQLLYLAECDPKARAHIVIDYSNFERPRILKLDLDAAAHGS